MKTSFPIYLSNSILIALLVVSAQAKDSNSAIITYSNFPLETAKAVNEGDLRILHRDDFATDTLHTVWGCSNPKTVIEDGRLKLHSNGGSSGKLKVAVEPFIDAELSFRFRLTTTKGFGFGFDDLTAKDISHGGHLIGFSFNNDRILVKDTLTGIYNMSHYQEYKDKKITPELKALFERCEKEIPYTFTPNQWYAARIRIQGDRLELYIDDRKLIEFRSPGISHPRKDMYRFNVAKGDMEFDDVTLVSYLK